MTKPEVLRRKLYEYDLAITDEYVVEDGGKMYVIITAEYCPFPRRLSEAEALCGEFDENDETACRYRVREAQRMVGVAENLDKAGRRCEAQHFRALAEKTEKGIGVEKISDIISFLDGLYPFEAQEKWDNSGYLVESPQQECCKVLLSLDITCEAIEEADIKCAELIISHHPVIFEPRKCLKRDDPVYRLIESGIGAVCMHTNLDIAAGGTNGVILEKLREKLELEGEPEPFEELCGGNGLGWIIDLRENITVRELAEICKTVFGCYTVRMSRADEKKVSRIAFCSGSGGSMLSIAAAKGCDCLITGDVKHDVWIDAANIGISVLDCGHFHTENIVLWELRRVLEERFPLLDIEVAESSVDPCEYV
jgi:dinuclear metal center YbgI/SA1388 family protein